MEDCEAADARAGARHAPGSMQLRELVQRHSAQLAQLLHEHMQGAGSWPAREFSASLEACRSQGQACVASWLYGVALQLLRQSLADSSAGRFAARFTEAFPQDFVRPMLVLALSGRSYAVCSIYLCKPAGAPARDFRLSRDSAGWMRRHVR